jgi:DNA mismatch endonuclease (patch repair protein)
VQLARVFRRSGISGWRRHYPVAGKPDFVFLNARLAIFVDGCFWHGCPRCYRSPRANRLFWMQKVKYNRHRDARVARFLRARGWIVLRIWEHSLRNEAAILRRVSARLPARHP